MAQRRADRLSPFQGSMWEEIEALVVEHKAVNLGKGFPNWQAPDFVKKASIDAINQDLNQYTRSMGHPKLVQSLSKIYSPLLQHEINPNTEVMITVGGAESLYLAFQAILNPGDEVILIEPFFDFYIDQLKLMGAKPVGVPLHVRPESQPGNRSSADLILDYNELEAAVTEKTRILVVNTPHNPTGKMFTREELEKIAEIAIKHNIIVISDEVYEWMALDAEHIRISTIPGMWERTLTIGSAGKTFSVTGWKIGWTFGPADLIEGMWLAHQRVVFTICTPLQEAVAVSFQQTQSNNYFPEFQDLLRRKRDEAVAFLRKGGFDPFVPQGSYMLLAEASNYKLDEESESKLGTDTEDLARCKQLIRKHQVASIPPSVFYTDDHKHYAKNLLRFCFCKTDDVIEAATVQFNIIGSESESQSQSQ